MQIHVNPKQFLFSIIWPIDCILSLYKVLKKFFAIGTFYGLVAIFVELVLFATFAIMIFALPKLDKLFLTYGLFGLIHYYIFLKLQMHYEKNEVTKTMVLISLATSCFGVAFAVKLLFQ